MSTINTETFAQFLYKLLLAMPPEGDFCKKVQTLATTDAVTDMWETDEERDYNIIVKELKDKFGDEIGLDEVIKEWAEETRR